MSKGNDINVGSIEEDIKILKELMEDVELTFAGWVDILKEREKKALKNLIQDYTKQKQINEEHQKTNGELREKVKELEEQVEYDKTHIYTPLTIQLNFIPKQKIKDKTEEIKEEYELLLEHQSGKESNRTKYLRGKIHMGQELLQESEDK